MRASELFVKEKPIKEIEAEIKSANERGERRIIINPFVNVGMETIKELIDNGFNIKQFKDMNGLDALLIE